MFEQTNLAGVPPAAYVELSDYLRTSGSTLRLSEAMGRAIQHWIAAQREAAEPLRGYQWKCLFLPAGSRIRMRHGEHSYYAEVVGEDLLYQGMPVSPRQFTVILTGEARNAWRDIWVRLHGEKQWTSAAKLRRALENRPAATSPVETMATAARTMSDALQTTLALVEHVHHKASLRPEQRIAKRRRVEDMALDD